MRILTNPGSNLPASLVQAYDIALAPQKIVVDGVEHDTRDRIELSTVDRWIADAREHPYVLGSSAAEFIDVLRGVAAHDRQIVAIMTSKKLIGSYTAAVSAVRTLRERADYADTTIEVLDTGMTDLGAGLVTLMAALAVREELSVARTVSALTAFAREAKFFMIPQTLDNLVKGGRASFLRAWIANMLSLSPVISLVDGDTKPIGKVPRKDDPAPHLVAQAVAAVGAGRSVWCAISHGDAPEKATRLAALLRKTFDVKYLLVQPFHSSIYLHTGRGSLGLFVAPVDKLPWTPSEAPQQA